jgi:hypothetical protein
VDYFRKPIYQNIWFAFATVFFLLAFGHELWVLSNHWSAIPAAMKFTFLSAVIVTPLLWVRAIRQHSSLRKILAKGLGLEDEVERQLLKEVASSSLFFLWLAYVIMNLIMEVVLHLIWRG